MAVATLMGLAQGPSCGVGAASRAGNSVFHPADFAIPNGRVPQPRSAMPSARTASPVAGFAAAPVFGIVVASYYGWHGALGAAAGVALVFAVLFFNAGKFVIEVKPKQAISTDMKILFSGPILACFLFFTLHAAALTGLMSFGISAMTSQFFVSAALASSAITAYMIGTGVGTLAGGFLLAQARRPQVVAGSGIATSACVMLAIAAGAVPGPLLPVARSRLAIGLTYPSRDLIVRGSTPPGAREGSATSMRDSTSARCDAGVPAG